ncbi:Aldehyde-alcohol dehydrogenase [Sporomusa silvacetica DSM 10669]|uniref:Aldehyde-alcohol dehydrogenase n=1 Tax=Sporomusa silvacetica DSM 10669 TaxID=1123289 RepID=A0ABZ3IE70_9FIRM|nr:iron-containing alcohol dehydrogenase [Sporomusa silvacetica]OZC22578.1 aldehyde-alcohol dehydrogenase [Sporomusa silvacetica DSM 10669]
MKKLVLGGQSIITGCGSIAELSNVKASRAFIVTGGSAMQTSGVIAKIEGIFKANGCKTCIYGGIGKNPDTQAVLDGLSIMREFEPDLLLAVGGGSPIDAAKVMGLFYEYPELDFAAAQTGELPAARKSLLFVAIPSTSGTGTEVTKAAVITFRELELKIGLKTPAFIPDLAILDPDITMTMPSNVVAETGMDALTHAVEAYINRNLDDFSEVLAKGAVAGLLTWLPVSYHEKNKESREKVHHYQCIAGLAFENTGLGMAHGISHAVGGKFDLGHGLINAIALPYVLAYNAQEEFVGARLDELARSIGRKGRQEFITAVKELNQQLAIPAGLAQAGVDRVSFEEGFDELTANCLKGSTRVNPVPVTKEQMAGILKELYQG